MPTPSSQTLEDIARGVRAEIPERGRDIVITGVAYDSRKAGPGHLFCCIPGLVTDGHLFASEAVAAGAVALIAERPLSLGVPELIVDDARPAAAVAAATFYGNPADELLMLGITGTNGKTTTTFMLESIMRAEGRTAGLIGTIETHIGSKIRPGVRTTPESVDLQKLLAEMVDAGVHGVAMEVTSHALALHRVDAIRFAAAGFTNLSQDHLDFHTGMEDYFEAKRTLFTPDRADKGAVNVDDPYGARLAVEASVPCIGYGIENPTDVTAVDIHMEPTESRFVIRTPKGDVSMRTPLVGSFNIYNCLAAAAISLQAGIGLDAIDSGLHALRAVPGRFESIDAGQPFTVVVDYAHTPDSLDNVLRAARDIAARSKGRVLCVFGAGGDRDRAKRPLMGAVAARLADYVVVTSDNPRSEEPGSIVDQILEGVIAGSPNGPDLVQVDRAEAIKSAVAEARAGDVLVIAGKGHETGQQFAAETITFDDRDVARAALAESGWIKT